MATPFFNKIWGCLLLNLYIPKGLDGSAITPAPRGPHILLKNGAARTLKGAHQKVTQHYAIFKNLACMALPYPIHRKALTRVNATRITLSYADVRWHMRNQCGAFVDSPWAIDKKNGRYKCIFIRAFFAIASPWYSCGGLTIFALALPPVNIV